MTEVWRDVSGWPYEVSDQGRVRKRGGALRKIHGAHSGYSGVTLWRPREHKLFYVHKLVADAFLGPLPDGMHTNHINCDKSDNRARNLEYVTPRYNSRHALRNGHGRAVHAKLDPEKVRYIRKMRDAGVPLTELAEELGVEKGTVGRAARGVTWRHA